MAQLTIYLPDAVVTATKKRARRANKSVSAWIAELIERETGARRWPKALLDVLTTGRGDIEEPADLPLEDIEPLR